jgi:hypothetical protein
MAPSWRALPLKLTGKRLCNYRSDLSSAASTALILVGNKNGYRKEEPSVMVGRGLSGIGRIGPPPPLPQMSPILATAHLTPPSLPT